MKRRCCERADKVIAISHSTKNDLVRFFDIPPEKIVVIHLASSLKSNNASPSVRPFHEPYLLFVGQRDNYKNFEGLIEAFEASEFLKKSFHIVCFGGEPLSSNENVRLKKLGLEDRVHNVRGSDELLCDYYNNAVAFICPSFYEGFGIPILEAMEFSCPVICSNIGSIPEVAGDAAVYFDPADTGSLQHAMETTLSDKNILDDLKNRGLERQSMFSWSRCADETLAVYNSLL
jgi:glycosyltransferase involved in cell wall biosynthesis